MKGAERPGRILQPALVHEPTFSQTRVPVLENDDVIMHPHAYTIRAL